MFVNGDGAKWRPATGDGWARASFQAVGAVKVRQHRPVRGTMKTLQLKREHRRRYVIVVAESEPVPVPATGREVGIDLGVARFLTASDGELVPNPGFLAAGRRCTRPRQGTVICPVHGAMDADVNGARNVYSRAGLGSGQASRAAREAVGFSR